MSGILGAGGSNSGLVGFPLIDITDKVSGANSWVVSEHKLFIWNKIVFVNARIQHSNPGAGEHVIGTIATGYWPVDVGYQSNNISYQGEYCDRVSFRTNGNIVAENCVVAGDNTFRIDLNVWYKTS